MSQPVSENNGFTLLEVMIAMFIFAIIITFLYFTFISLNRARYYTVKSSMPFYEADLIFNKFHSKILEFNYVYPVLIAKRKKVSGKVLSSIYFTGFAHKADPFFLKESNENINYFYLKKRKHKNIHKNVYNLIYKESFFKSAKGNLTVSHKKAIIADNVTFFSISYFYNGLWLKTFNYSIYNSAPKAVKIKFGILVSRTVKKFEYEFNM